MQDPFNNQNDPNQEPNDPLAGLPIPPNYAKIVHREKRQVRIAKVGISWTTFFFGPIPAIFRGDWYNFAVMIAIQLGYGMLMSMLGLENIDATTFTNNLLLMLNWLPAIFFSVFYNKMYFQHLFSVGFEPGDDRSKALLVKNRYWKD